MGSQSFESDSCRRTTDVEERMYRAEVLADSLHPTGGRLVTFRICLPRCVIAEAVTHRLNSDSWGWIEWCERTTTPDVSKNSASSRAIPLARMVQRVMDDPHIPDRFGGAGSGMQSHGWLEGADHDAARHQWLMARDDAVTRAVLMLSRADRERVWTRLTGGAKDLVGTWVRCSVGPSVSVHKETVNRLLEPWAWVTQIVTSAHWDNFFALRCHEAAHPALRKVARLMFLARQAHESTVLDFGNWHVPFADRDRVGQRTGPFWWDVTGLVSNLSGRPFVTHEVARSIIPIDLWRSVARCAWVSYDNAEKDATDAAVMATVDRLIGSRPVHASPSEAQAMCVPAGSLAPGYRSNLGDGWLQLRKLLPGERCDRYDPPATEVAAWPESAASGTD